MMKSQGRENAQAQASASNPDAPKKNHFHLSNIEVIKRDYRTWSPVC